MKTMKFAVMIACAAISTTSLAWGDREQGALAGLIGGLAAAVIIHNSEEQHQPPSPPAYVRPQIQHHSTCGYNVWCPPPPPPPVHHRPQVCQQVAVVDQNGYFMYWTTQCWR